MRSRGPQTLMRFNSIDPIEGTETRYARCRIGAAAGFNSIDPIEGTETARMAVPLAIAVRASIASTR